MGEAAQGEPRNHTVFQKPFIVKPVFEQWDTPSNYRRFPGGEKLPATVKVWRIQTLSDRPGGMAKPYGVVSRSWGYGDFPDAEVLTPGYNTGKENGAVGVGRHGNFLQWGFSAPPSKMTDAGRAFFLNSVCYIAKFDGKAPLVHRKSSDRFSGVRLIKGAIESPESDFYTSLFPPELLEKYKGDADGMFQYYMDHYELIFRDNSVYKIDKDLQALGLKSNRKIETLEKLIILLWEKDKAEAARMLLGRYTAEDFATPGEWKKWFNANRGRIYFTDVGGQKFLVVPEGYLEK